MQLRRDLFTTAAQSGADTKHTAINPMDELQHRGLVYQTTSRAITGHLASPLTHPRTIYLGIDPSAPSLHLGNLLPLFALFHLVCAGHTGIVLVGGATGAIGDPSGRSTERSALARSALDHNLNVIVSQLCDFFKAADVWAAGRRSEHAANINRGSSARDQRNALDLINRKETLASVKVGHGHIFVVNNRAFYEDMNVLDFLSSVGRYVRIGDMLARDSVKRRIQPTTDNPNPPGLSFTEFSYQLLQAYDFSLLHRSPWNCTVQLGGSDQLGNISAGIDLVRRQQLQEPHTLRQNHAQSPQDQSSTHGPEPAYGLTVPLLTTSSGAKFGKSAGNAIWLDQKMTSDLHFYQYFLRNVPDADVGSLLDKLTLMSPQERSAEASPPPTSPSSSSAPSPSAERPQMRLATHLTALLRSEAALDRAQRASRILFHSLSDFAQYTRADVESAFAGLPILHRLSRGDVLGKEVWKLCADVGLVSSRAEGRRTLINGGVYLNSTALGKAEVGRAIGEADLLGAGADSGGFLVVRSGKNSHAVVLVD